MGVEREAKERSSGLEKRKGRCPKRKELSHLSRHFSFRDCESLHSKLDK